ncbi:MAG: Gfo/Idh/MocA family oxidoreductase [Deltaproteobacteria bacterium]|nr:Gfo/Idh/MocA family oxidoreductase [Deltaproteobacteria bacterium]
MNRLRVAVIGVGHLGRFHAAKYSGMKEVDLVGVVDIDSSRAKAAASEFNTNAFTDYRDVLDLVDAVSIAVPTSVHRDVAVPCLKKKVAVLLEKPMASNLEEAKEIISAAHEGGSTLQVGHLERFNPVIMELSGRIKRPMFIEAHRISPFTNRGIDVDVILDLMIHDIDIILTFVKSDIASVEVVGVPVLTDKIDIANARIRFSSGCIANITASRVSADVMRKIRVFQPDSYVSIDYAKKAVDIYTMSQDKKILHNYKEINDPDALETEIASFVHAVLSGERPVVDGMAGLKAMQVVKLLKDSITIPRV